MEQAALSHRLLAKARQDQTALRALGDDPAIADETIGFFTQPSADETLKAVLAALGGRLRRTHGLERLHRAAAALGQAPPCSRERLAEWTPFAVAYRYGDLPDGLDAEDLDRAAARDLVAQVLAWTEACLTALRPGPPPP